MNRFKITFAFMRAVPALLLILVSATVCYGRADQSFLLFFSNDVLGETEPCG